MGEERGARAPAPLPPMGLKGREPRGGAALIGRDGDHRELPTLQGQGHRCTPGPHLPGGGAELELGGAHLTWLSQGSPCLAPSDITVVSAKKGSKKVNLEQF